jgi:hypothetical protein
MSEAEAKEALMAIIASMGRARSILEESNDEWINRSLFPELFLASDSSHVNILEYAIKLSQAEAIEPIQFYNLLFMLRGSIAVQATLVSTKWINLLDGLDVPKWVAGWESEGSE